MKAQIAFDLACGGRGKGALPPRRNAPHPRDISKPERIGALPFMKGWVQ